MLWLAVIVCWEAVDIDDGDDVLCVESGDEEAILLVALLCPACKHG